MKLVSTREFYEASQALPWIIDPFAVRGSMILLYGRQGIGKSSLAWQLANAVSTGGTWLGHGILQAGPVIYLNFDMPHFEFQRMLQRGTDASLEPSENIFIPDLGDTEAFDMLHHQLGIVEACAVIQPRLVIVDTVADGFMSGSIRDVNAEARAVIGQFRRLIQHGFLLLLLHDRKQPSFGGNPNDPDAFLGPTAWEAKATTSFRMTSTKDGVRLHVKKARLDKPPYDSLLLIRTDEGFFTAQPTFMQALQAWPLGSTNGLQPQHLREVFADVAQRFGEHEDTVKRAYNRAIRKGVFFPWAAAFSARDRQK